MSWKRPDLSREEQKALADLCRFGQLLKYGDWWAASPLHLPECAHTAAVLAKLVDLGLAKFDKPETRLPTQEGRFENERYFAERGQTVR